MAYVKCIRNLISSTVPDGKTVTPTDDISIWLACGGRSETYTTLSEVLNDSVCLSALIADSNAVDYLVRSTTWASGITSDSSAMSYIGLNNYASNTLLADSTWCNAICNSTYFESVLNVKVPAMTSNTTPSGECFGSSIDGANYDFYKAFDNGSGGVYSNWASGDGQTSNQYIGYNFGTEILLCKIVVSPYNPVASDANGNCKNVKVQAFIDNAWVDIDSQFQCDYTQGNKTQNLTPTTSEKFRLYCIDNWGNPRWIYVGEIQFYGRADI